MILARFSFSDGSEVLIFDRADLLTAPGRRGIWNLCKESGLQSVICISASSPDDLPGRKIWLDKGAVGG